METIINYYKKYKEMTLYIIFGGLTTVINFSSYWILTRFGGAEELTATVIAWILSVLFAYVTNRVWVFESREKRFAGVMREMGLFFAGRLFSGALDVGIMGLFVKLLGFNDMLIKILSNVIVIIVNYIFSKLFVFRKSKKN